MPFQLSPGVNVTEIDLTTVVPAVATSDGAIAGIFNWGPVGERILIDSETKLVDIFGKPNNNNAETWFTAANFLSYSNRLYVVRAANTGSTNNQIAARNAFANVGSVANVVAQVVRNRNEFEAKEGTFDSDIVYLAKYPGSVGNSLRISVCDSTAAYSSQLYANGLAATEDLDVSANFSISIGNANLALSVLPGGTGTATDANTYAHHLVANLAVGDYMVLGNTQIQTQYAKIANIGSIASNSTGAYVTITFEDTYRLSTNFAANSTINNKITRNWEFFNFVDHAPQTSEFQAAFGSAGTVDGIHVVVVDDMGKFSGTPGTVLETFRDLSRATDAKSTDGATTYYKTVINNSSKYIWAVNDRSGAESNTAINLASSTNGEILNMMFVSGTDGYTEATAPLSVIAGGYDMFGSSEDIDISLVLQGKPIAGSTVSSDGQTIEKFQLANYLIDNIVENRKDCVAFISPDDTLVSSNYGNEAISIVNWRNAIHDSSYAVMDTGYKYQYDRYNDVYRYVPMNGDVAGLCARTDNLRDPWWSPAGFNRGQIKNLVKLRFNPRKADRDILYKNGVNPVVSFPGQGTILYGDKTIQSKPSAFDRINVRRLFIVLEKAIAVASKYTLFEFNDEFTRAQFKNLVTPYLRDVQGRRGITDFLVVCDATNNTAERIDRNEFWGDIYIKPARSINFIQLNFVAVRTGVQFSEIVGKF
jgi:phage tail sheath protein FI